MPIVDRTRHAAENIVLAFFDEYGILENLSNGEDAR